MKTRREFLKKASVGSVAVSSLAAFSACGNESSIKNTSFDEKNTENVGFRNSIDAKWAASFDEAKSALTLTNGPVSVTGQLSFISGNDNWTVAKSRDAIKNRCAIVDTKGNVQGYFVLCSNGGEMQICFYHRTAQRFQGTLSFKGEICFFADSFACRTKALLGERILSFSDGMTDSLLTDSLFAPENDTILQMDAANLGIKNIVAGKFSVEMSGDICEASETVFSINLEADYFKNRYVPYYKTIDRKRCPKTPTGWMSWNTYFDKATAEDNLDEARIGKKYLQPFGCEFWHIESWQGNSDQLPVSKFYNMNLEANEKQFPKGMKQLADDIRELGFRPGLWMAPFGTGNQEFYDAHKEWFLHNSDGQPRPCWNGLFTLDPSVPEAREHLKNIFHKASREWGYEYFKIDGMSGRNHGYCAHLYERPEVRARFKNPSCPNPFELCVKAFREGIGEDRIFLACQGHTSGPEALYADASRIGADIVHPNRPVKWGNVYNQGRCTINQVFTHNIAMIADPDTLLVKDLPLEEARVSATIVALPGQLTFFGDKLAELSEDRMKILQQTLPVANVRPVSLFPYFSMLPVWNLRVENTMLDDYNVVALFNWEDETKTISFTTEELGIDSEADYAAYEFWTQKSYGTVQGDFAMEVPAHAVRLLAIHKKQDIPQWISSDRHITQNAVELKEYKWISDKRALEGKIELIGSFPLTMRIRVPQGFQLSEADCSGAQCTAKKEEKDIVAVTFKSAHTGDFMFKISF